MKRKRIFTLLCLLWFALVSAAIAQTRDGAISILPATQYVAPGEETRITIELDTGSGPDGVTFLQAYIDFDDALLDILSSDVASGIDTGTWDLLVEKEVDGNKIRIMVASSVVVNPNGVKGSNVLVANIRVTAKPMFSGFAALTFEKPSGTVEGTRATTRAMDEILAAYNDAEIIVRPQPPFEGDWQFASSSEGWTFSDTIDPFVPPTDSSDDGFLNMTAASAANCYGFWYSPMDAVPLVADNLYRVRYGMKSDRADRKDVPTFRIRWNSSNFKQSDYVMVRSNDAGEASPDTTVQDYDLYFKPQHEALDPGVAGQLSWDLLNIDSDDAATGTISVDYVEWKRTDVPAGFVSFKQYDFEAGMEGWISSGKIGTFDQPLFSEGEGTLVMECDNSNNTFGFWQNPHDGAGALSMDHTVLYQLRVKAGRAASGKFIGNEPPLMRVRMYDHPNNQMINVYQTPVWTRYIQPKGGRQLTFQDYYSYFHNRLGIGPAIGIAVDIVNLDTDESPTGIVEIEEVELSFIDVSTLGM